MKCRSSHAPQPQHARFMVHVYPTSTSRDVSDQAFPQHITVRMCNELATYNERLVGKAWERGYKIHTVNRIGKWCNSRNSICLLPVLAIMLFGVLCVLLYPLTSLSAAATVAHSVTLSPSPSPSPSLAPSLSLVPST